MEEAAIMSLPARPGQRLEECTVGSYRAELVLVLLNGF